MFSFFYKKSQVNINLYTTQLPKNGWIFECLECFQKTSNSIKIKHFELYLCKHCEHKIILNKDYKKIYYKKCIKIKERYKNN